MQLQRCNSSQIISVRPLVGLNYICLTPTRDLGSQMQTRNNNMAPMKKLIDAKTTKQSSVNEEATRKVKRNLGEENEELIPKKTKTDSKSRANKTDTDLEGIDFSCEKTNADNEIFNIKICSWNVSGLRAVIKKKGFEYIEREDADIVALQEIKCDSTRLPNEVKLPGYKRYFAESKKKGYSGVALFSKIKPSKVIYGLRNPEFDDEGRMITAEYEKFFLVTVYVPNSGNKLVNLPKRLMWNAALKEFIKKLDKEKPVIICGDMNVAHQEIDLTNPKSNVKNAGFSQEERDGMTNFLKDGFVDSFRLLYPQKTGAYSFWAYFKNSREKNIGWRLDYFLVSERIKNKICDSNMRDKVYGSDHCPIVLFAHL